MGWRDISTAPTDGSRIWVKRAYEGRIIKEGWAVFGVCCPEAPQRSPIGPDPLNRLSADDYAREDQERTIHADTPKWLTEDRQYSFPSPTHWFQREYKEG